MTTVFVQSLRSRVFVVMFMCAAFGYWPEAARAADRKQAADTLVKATSDFKSASSEYKSAVENLMPAYEAAVETAAGALETRKRLFAEGLVSKKELEEAEAAVARARELLASARGQLASTDRAVREAEVRAERAMRAPAPAATARPAVLRSLGSSGWSLARVSAVQAFFGGQFGRALPVSAFGQSSTHDRLGWDHRNAIDVSVRPDSREGQALIAFLRSNGIPFQAFTSAIPGVATGAHIHIGLPSRRLG